MTFSTDIVKIRTNRFKLFPQSPLSLLNFSTVAPSSTAIPRVTNREGRSSASSPEISRDAPDRKPQI